jgi:hypothetical protein
MTVRTAVTGISLIRMRPEVQVLPGPPPAMTSENADQRVRSFVRRRCAGSRTLTWLPLLVMDVLLQVSAQAVACHAHENGPKRTIDDLFGPPC